MDFEYQLIFNSLEAFSASAGAICLEKQIGSHQLLDNMGG